MTSLAKKIAPFACAVALLGAAPASAAIVTNGSFEQAVIDPAGGYSSLGAGSTSITGWTVIGSIDYIGGYWAASEGSRSLDIDGASHGGIQQLLTGLTPGQLYQVTFDLAGNPDNGADIKTLVASADATSAIFTFDTTGKTRSAMGWQSQSFSFTAAGSSVLLSFASGDPAGNCCWGPALDNVAVSAIPEPSTWAMMILGFSGLAWLGWRRRHTLTA